MSFKPTRCPSWAFLLPSGSRGLKTHLCVRGVWTVISLPLPRSHHQLLDALAIHLLPAQHVAVESDLVSDLGRATQVAEDQAADGVEVLALERRAQDLVDRMDRDPAVYRVGSVLAPLPVRLLLVE